MRHMDWMKDVCEDTCKKVLEKQESILRENADGENLSSQELDDLKDCCKILHMSACIMGVPGIVAAHSV